MMSPDFSIQYDFTRAYMSIKLNSLVFGRDDLKPLSIQIKYFSRFINKENCYKFPFLLL